MNASYPYAIMAKYAKIEDIRKGSSILPTSAANEATVAQATVHNEQ